VAGAHRTALTDFQVEVATLFFSLPSSGGFLLAGGAALVAQRLTTRPTQDLDFFTSSGAAAVHAVRDDFTAAAENRGWPVTRIRDHDTFCRLLVTGAEDLIVDIALDSSPSLPPKASFAGPTFGPQELAGRKVIALFDRAAARDFVDVYMLTRRFALQTLLSRAQEIDAGFDSRVLADMIGLLERYSDVDLGLGGVDVPALREFFRRWRADLLAASPD
jgi:hypothetical protein